MQKLLAVAALSLFVVACTDPAAEADGQPDAVASAGKGGRDKTGAPIVKAGLWEVTSGEGTDMASTVKLCTHDPLDSDRTYLQADPGDGCTAERKDIPGGLQQVTRCDFFGKVTVMDTTFRGGAEAFELISAITTGPSGAVSVTRKAKRLGACPSGMSDGDAVGADG